MTQLVSTNSISIGLSGIIPSFATTNPNGVPLWMFHDAMFMYWKHIFEELQQKYVDGDVNVKVFHDGIDFMLTTIENTFQSSVEPLIDQLKQERTKLAAILNHTI